MITGRHAALLAGLAIAALAAMLLALVSGSADISLGDTLAALRGAGDNEIFHNVIDLRLSRGLTAFAIGGLLAVAGVLMQVLLRNPLAEPYILGTSGGAAVAALLAMILGAGQPGRRSRRIRWRHGSDAAGVLDCAWHRQLGAGQVVADRCRTGRRLQCGNHPAAGAEPDSNLRGMLFWLMGDLSYALDPATQLASCLLILTAGGNACRKPSQRVVAR